MESTNGNGQVATDGGGKAAEKRDASGRFLPGHAPLSPGRPRKHFAYEQTTFDKCSLEDWGEIVEVAVDKAKGGDRHARDFLAKYLLPQRQPLETGPDWQDPDEIDRQFEEMLAEMTAGDRAGSD